ncbi:MAG: sulfite exporter TauE/SafE family protein [Alphaproteobacteria bacterium]|nr:sulfite exporter TauE/SafE family protein [Alphaproteobacteria bacterium]
MARSFLAFLIGEAGLSPWVFLGLCATTFVGSLIAASIGLGGGVLVLAVMAQVFAPAVLIPLHGVVQFGSNAGRAALMFRRAVFGIVPAFAVGTVIGSIVGANLFVALPVWLLQLVLALFVLYATWAPSFQPRTGAKGTFFGVGLVSGFITLFIGGSAPFVAPFVRAACADRREFVATVAVFMVLQHGVKIAAFGALGFAFGPYLPLLAVLLVCGFCGTVSGRLLLERLPERVFAVGLKIVLTVLAARLLYAASRAILA